MAISEFQTSELDLAAAIMTGTGRQPEVFQQPGRPLVTFEFPADEATLMIIMAFAGGELVQPVKSFAGCRAWLYRRAREVRG